MSQINVFDDRYGSIYEFPCPKCGTIVGVEDLRFSLANLLKEGIKCSDCGCEFTVGTVLLDPRSPTLREADGDTCPDCKGKGIVKDGQLALFECARCKGSGHV